ncbi:MULTISPECIES: hypothetical protein [Ureibacillus]|uniref:Uncharacterized protein n=1 Tax=Ureibacillus chungkukjangi TaxID=1202712 RepID=A0A318TV80_9BACL|nr:MULTISPECIES: hypothetical protein [Ureibacillus]MCM3390393.1 hypothetical protein [Ureibacillus chungkukjangi]PYF08564.1 hypothetical protein BJ095_102331 [Ureibacillus chungkukjangi]
METRGRKPKIFPQEEINKIIYQFTQEEKVSGWLKYSEVYRYSKKLYENETIPYQLSEDYWRRDGRQGKETIDKINKAYEAALVNKKTTESDVYIDTQECVDKFFTGKPSDKRRLIEALKLNEKKAKNYNELLGKMNTLKGTMKALKQENKELEELLQQYQTVLFSWFNASIKSDVPLINLMATGKTRHPIVDFFFDTSFSNPTEGYEKFEEFRKRLKGVHEEPTINNNVLPLSQGIESLRQKHKKE